MITQSKLKSGTFTLGATPAAFACQATNVQIVPDHDTSGDAVETLCGDSLTPDAVRTDTVKVTAIQDFDDEDGFIAYTWLHDLETVPFSWKPNADSPTYTGSVQIKAATVGGDVNSRITSDVEWDVVGAVTVTYPA